MTSYPPGDCVECRKPLNALDIKHGWLTSDLGWNHPNTRVHTICKRKFEERPLAQRRIMAEAVR